MNINETMLFRWMGYWIENEEGAKEPANRCKPLALNSGITSEQRQHYLKLLKGALNPDRGMLVSDYSELDQIGKNAPVVKPQPCLFFTEQAATSSDDHWRLYGRLGMGFSKRAIFRQGGRPVIYTGGKNDPVEKAVRILRKHFTVVSTQKERESVEALEFLARLIKSTGSPKPQTAKKPPTSKDARKPQAVKRVVVARPMSFPNEQRIAFLNEREWRMLAPQKFTAHWSCDDSKQVWYRPKIGSELQVVILPDNETLYEAIECNEIRGRLLARDRPPLQLLTAELLRKV